MGCFSSKQPAPSASATQVQPDSHKQLAEETHFSVDEVYALEELFKEVSNALHKDGLIHKDEFTLALFKTANRSNLFAERVFDLFDSKRNDVIDFEEFTRALSVFHPTAPLEEKATFAFRIYDLGKTGAIERGEVMRFLVALLLDNPAISLDEAELENVVNQTFEEADIAGDGRINPDEWQILVAKNPAIINYMTLPVLGELTMKYPSFAFNIDRL